MYTAQWTLKNPGHLIYLIDQSSSMSDDYKGIENYNLKTKAEFTAMVINQQINELILTNLNGYTCKDKIIVTIIAYGGNNLIKILRSDPLSKYMENPLFITTIKKSHVDTNGKMQFLEEEIPAFIEPEANGTTPMSLCFQKVIDFINKKYSNDSPEMPAPIIINISDGMPYLGGDLEVEEEIEPAASVKQAEKLMNISLHDGKPLLYNVHIGDSATECCFIASESDLPPNDEQAEFLFSISSKVPNEHREAAKKFGFDTPTNARGFVSNALPDTLIRFINFGSSSHTSNLN